MSTHEHTQDQPADTAVERPVTGRHPVNIGHLVMGLVFAVFLGLWAIVQFTDIASRDLRFLLPVPWIAGGAVGLIALAVRDRRRLRNGRWDAGA